MVLRLINDAVWRMRFLYLSAIAFMIFAWLVSASGYAPRSTGLMVSLMLAYMLGPMFSHLSAGMRELRVLPVTSREHWQTVWILSVVVGPLFLVTAGLLAATGLGLFAESGRISAETLFLNGLFLSAYAGALLPIGPLASQAGMLFNSRGTTWFVKWMMTLGIVSLVGGMVLPWFIAGYLPLTLDEVTAPALIGLAACLGLAGAAWAWTPRHTVRPSQEAYRAASAGPGMTLPLENRFSGISSVLLPHVVSTLTIALVSILGAAVYSSVVDSGDTIAMFLKRHALLPLDSSPVTRVETEALLLVFVATSTGPWNTFARVLKVLPLAAREINALLVLTPLVTWTVIWLVLVLTHTVVVGSLPGTIRLELLVFGWGVSAFVQSLALRFKRPGFFFPWYVMPMGIAANLVQNAVSSPDSIRLVTALVCAGVAALGLAAFLNHRTLARSSSNANVYKRQVISLPFAGV